MADRRKLQGEIDRCLKKVTEGVEIFDDIWQKVILMSNPKVHGATNANQKEKYEADLKKEIKKLQRLRDQIKTWTSSSDIKDKRVLQENRKLIETQMERFKVVERETKTKAYSKEGLSGAIQKTDPAQKEREEMRQWVTASIGTLNLQIEQFESEIETLILTSKKKKLEKDKQDRVDQVRKYMEKHKHHVKQLETLLRMLDNNNIETESIRNIKDDIEYYIECSQEPDFKENEYIYEDLNLDEANDDSLTNSSPPSTTCSSPTPSSPHTVQNFSKSFSQEDEYNKVKGQRGRTDDEMGGSNHVTTSLFEDVSHSSSPTDHVTVVTCLTATPHKSTPPSRVHPHAHADSPATRRQSTENQLFSGSLPLPTGPPIPYAAIAGHVTSSMSGADSSTLLHQHQSSFQSSFTPLLGDGITMPSRAQNLMNISNDRPQSSSLPTPIVAADSLKSIASQIVMASSNLNTPAPTHNQSETIGPKRTATEDLIQEQQSRRLCILKRLLRDHQQQQEQHQEDAAPGSLEISSYIDNLKDILLASSAASASSSHVTASTVLGQVLDVGPVPLEPMPPIQAPPVTDNKKFIEEVLSRMVVSGHHGVEQALRAGPPPDPRGFPHPQQGHALCTLRGEAVVTPLLAASPLGPIQIGPPETYRASLVDRVYNSETALPKAMDSEKTRWLLNRTPYGTPSYYNNPSCSIDNSDFYQRLSTETLFFVFYYFEGSKAQYMAAKALKKLSWRFHTKYLMWFQRHEEPKTITDEYEQGTYIYFDYEKWSQRRKEGFTFEYKFLEDRDLS